MFWRFGGYANVSTIDSLLDKPDVTLEELLDEPDLIQELKQHNTKLIEYLRDDNVLNRLLNYVIAPGPLPNDADEDDEESLDEKSADDESKEKAKGPLREKSDLSDEEQEKAEKNRLKYSYVACEVLSSETWSILESLMVNHEHLKEFWNFMRRPPPLDPLQAGYFTKVNETLLEKKTEDMLAFFKSIDGVVQAMLQHVDCPMVMDLLLKIISLEKSEGGEGIVEWLQEQRLIPILLSYLSPEFPSSTQTSAGDFLKAIITISANASQNEQSCIGPNSLTRELVSEACMETLISSMLRGGNPLTVGVGIVIEVIRKNNSDYDPDVGGGSDGTPSSHDPIYLGTLLRMFAKHVPDFMDLILSSKHTIVDGSSTKLVERGQLKSAWGNKIEPLGFDRFKTCELMAELLHCSNMGLLNERGSEDFVRQRDAERQRLRAEGKLRAHREGDSGVQYTQDSTGFTNGVSPSALAGSPEEIRRFEIGKDEDGFEDVAASGVLNDEVKDDFDEKSEEKDKSAGEAFTTIQNRPRIDLSDEFMDEPLASPRLEAQAGEKMAGEDVPPPLQPRQLDPTSPTTSGLTEKVRRFSLEKGEKDTQMTTSDEEKEIEKLSPKPLEEKETLEVDTGSPVALSPRAEDTPPPLFAASSTGPPREEVVSPKTVDPSGSSVDTTLGEVGDSSHSVIMSGNEQLFEPHIETDIDGRPVVGDYLKITFVENRVVPTILSFFFRFPWNNFLHNVVYDVVQQVFNGPMDRGFNRSLAIDLFETGRITDQIVEGQQRSDAAQQEKNMRLGYMGHLTLVAEEVVKFSERHPAELLSPSVMDRVLNSQWATYVEHILSETRERDNAILGGVRPDLNVGTRQAVLNAVSAAQGFSLANAGLNGGNTGQGLDTIDLANSGSASSGTFGLGSGSSLLSGFGSSSDDEDEDMEEGEEDDGGVGRGRTGAEEGSSDNQPSAAAGSAIPLIPPPPPPLNIHNPSRARRQLAARLARHKRQQASDGNEEDAGDQDLTGEGNDDYDNDAEDTEVLFPSASDFQHPQRSDKAPKSPTKATDTGRNFSSLFSSSSSSSQQRHRDGNRTPSPDDDDDDDDSSEDSTDIDDGSSHDTEDDDESLLRPAAGKSPLINTDNGVLADTHGIGAGQLPSPSEFEEDDEEMGEMVAPTAEPNSSDEEEIDIETSSSDDDGRQILTPKSNVTTTPATATAIQENQMRTSTQTTTDRNDPPAIMHSLFSKSFAGRPTTPAIITETPQADEDDDDDEDGLVEIRMGLGSPTRLTPLSLHSRSGSKEETSNSNKTHARSGSDDAGESPGKANRERKGSLGKRASR